jgi:hypothetical protein
MKLRLFLLGLGAFCMVQSFASVSDGYGQDEEQVVWNDVKKGQYPERPGWSLSTMGREEFLLEQEADEIFSTWKGNGLTLVTQRDGSKVLSTGEYPSGSELWLLSRSIVLPSLKSGEKLYVDLDQEVEVEYYYDHLFLSLSTDGGDTFSDVYAFSGKQKKGAVCQVDISEYAGKEVNFKFRLVSDESEQGAGWNLQKFSLVKSFSSSSVELRSGGENSEYDLELTNVRLNDDGSGFVDLYLSKDKVDILMNKEEIKLSVNGIPAAQCGNIEMFNMTDEVEPLNIVFLVDNSGSMRTYQRKVNDAMTDLITALGQYSPNVALMRFGQSEGDGCPLFQGNDRGINSFNLNPENGSIADFLTNIWAQNVQKGGDERYYYSLIQASKEPFSKVSGAQLVLILLGDESVTDGLNGTGCDGLMYGTSMQNEVANTLCENGAQVFVIQSLFNKTEYETICQKTRGEFYDIGMSDYSAIARSIGEKLSYKCRVNFCTEQEYKCGQTILVTATAYGEEVREEATVDAVVYVNRTRETEEIDFVNEGTSVDLAFEVSGLDKECIVLSRADINYFVVNGNDTTPYKIENVKVENGILGATIPSEDVVGEKILYNVRLYFEDENGEIIDNPYVTHSDSNWEIGIENDRPQISDVTFSDSTACVSRTVCAKITDSNGISSAQFFYKTLPSGAFTEVSMQKSAGDSWCVSLDANEGTGASLFYYIVATDNSGSKLKSNYGESSNPKELKYKRRENNGSTDKYKIVFSTDRKLKCAKLAKDKSGTFFFYNRNECGSLELLDSVYVPESNGSRDYIEVNLSLQNSVNNPNGYKEGDNVVIHFAPTGSSVEYVAADIPFEEDMSSFDVCIPNIVNNLNMMVSNEVTVRSTGGAQTVLYGDTIDYGLLSRAVSRQFTITNDEDGVVMLNDIEISGRNVSVLNYKQNEEIDFEGSTSFDLVYTPNSSEVTEVRLYNNTLQNPFVFYVKATRDESEICKEMVKSVTVYEEGALVQVHTINSLSEVNLALKERDGEVLREVTYMMGGEALQNIYLSTTGMDPNKEYQLTVRVDSSYCENAYLFNAKNEDVEIEAENNCNELLRNLSVNSWGTMADVVVNGNVDMTELKVYTIQGLATDVFFGPQLMGGPVVYSLYLPTNKLTSGTYILRVKVADKVCTQQFVNKK